MFDLIHFIDEGSKSLKADVNIQQIKLQIVLSCRGTNDLCPIEKNSKGSNFNAL